MKKKNRVFCFFALAVCLSLFRTALPAFSEEANLSEAYGMVKSISKNQMVVTVYDTQSGQAREEAFSLSPETELVIVRPASEVVEGDEVKINYLDQKGKKAARFVSILDLPAPPKTQKAKP